MADKFADYYKIDIEAHAVIDSKKVPLSFFRINYTIDQMPTAELHLPVGRQVHGDSIGSISSAEGLLKNAGPFTPVKVFVKASPFAGRAAPQGKSAGFPPGKSFLIFDGFLAEPSYEKTRGGSVGLALRAYGRPAGLAGTTQFSTGASVQGIGGGMQDLVMRFGNANFGKLLLWEEFEKLGGDVAGNVCSAIVVLMDTLAKLTGDWAKNNSAASAAINSLVVYKDFNLRRNMPGEAGEMLNKQVAAHIIDLFFDPQGSWSSVNTDGSSGDLWDVLMKLRRHFYFRFIPTIDKDYLAPVTQGLNVKVYKVIDANEYWQIGSRKVYGEKDYSYITKVSLFTQDFQPSTWEDIRTYPSLGFAEIDAARLPGGKPGRLKALETPAWLVPPDPSGQNSINPGGPVPDASNPEVAAQKKALYYDTWFKSKLGDTVAETILHEMLFAHRAVSLIGRLRMDISPGSLVRVNTRGEMFTGINDELFGIVQGVELVGGSLGESSNIAQTSFLLSSPRSLTEFNKLGVTAHPVYGTIFNGASLSTEVT